MGGTCEKKINNKYHCKTTTVRYTKLVTMVYSVDYFWYFFRVSQNQVIIKVC